MGEPQIPKKMNWLQKFWKTLTTGWVVEYPGRTGGDSPPDFFEVQRKKQRDWNQKGLVKW
jgi:hypothetical protein